MNEPTRRIVFALLTGVLALIPSTAAADAQSAFDRGSFATRVDSLADAFLADGPVAGIAVAVERDGELILARGYGYAELEHGVPMTVESIFRIGSISKQFVAVAILQLVEQGKLNLDDPIDRFIPDFPMQGHEITVHHLLTHTSGIHNYTSMGPTFWDQAMIDLTHDEMVGIFKDEPLDFTPGEKWSYSNSGYYLLGMIVEKVIETPVVSMATPDAGSVFVGAPSATPTPADRGAASWSRAQEAGSPSYSDYLDEHLFRPLGMTASSYCDQREVVPNRAQGYDVVDETLVNDEPISMNTPGAAGALCSNVLDMMRWQRALDNNTVISAESRRLMLTEATLADGSAAGYAYGLQIGELEGHRKVSHGGGINGFNTMHATYPDDRLVVTVFANTASDPGFIESQIARLVLGLPLQTTLDLPTDGIDLDRFAGSYLFDQVGLTAELEVREGQLWMLIGDSDLRLKYQGDDTFGMQPGQFLAFMADGTAELRAGGQAFIGTRQPD